MTAYKIYQIDRDSTDLETYLSVTCDYYQKETWLENIQRSLKNEFFKLAMLIESPDLDTVFEIGNFMGDVEPVVVGKARSVSIGDLVVDTETSRFFVVAPFGFEELTFN